VDKHVTKKLMLNRETLRVLDRSDLDRVVAGIHIEPVIFLTTGGYTCMCTGSYMCQGPTNANQCQ
jgi:hypothetical protein